jgi:uncharacterized protein (DUF433 family)
MSNVMAPMGVTLDDIHACLAYARDVIRSERMFAVKS